MIFTIIHPISSVQLALPDDLINKNWESADNFIEDGIQYSAQSQKEIILAKATEYIIKKANELNCTLEVDLTISDDPPYVPVSIRLIGNISPYAKSTLSLWLAETMNINVEDQSWNG